MKLTAMILAAVLVTLGYGDVRVVDDSGEVKRLAAEAPLVIVSDEGAKAPEKTLGSGALYVTDGLEVPKKLTEATAKYPLYEEDKRKARVIVLTDGETDDRDSMLRFLLYSNEMDVAAIIQTNSIHQKDGHSRNTQEYWLEELIEAYGEVLPNLRVHDKAYPTEAFLLGRIYIGDEERKHLAKVPPFEDTPGSKRIVQVLLDDDPRPVWVQGWGGTNTLAQALYSLKHTEAYTEADYKKAVAKLRVYCINAQDASVDYMAEAFPEVVLLKNLSYYRTWDYHHDRSPSMDDAWVKNHIRGHSPYGDLYRGKYVFEGDTPSFLNMMDNGLRGDENPGYGGWGGRFEAEKGNYYLDAEDQRWWKYALEQYVGEAQDDFQARMDWTGAKGYADANHRPVAEVNQGSAAYAEVGQWVHLDAKASYDPDGDKLTFKWQHHYDADDTKAEMPMATNGSKVSFRVPEGLKGGDTIHLILEVTDDGSPTLRDYQRFIITVSQE